MCRHCSGIPQDLGSQEAAALQGCSSHALVQRCQQGAPLLACKLGGLIPALHTACQTVTPSFPAALILCSTLLKDEGSVWQILVCLTCKILERIVGMSEAELCRWLHIPVHQDQKQSSEAWSHISRKAAQRRDVREACPAVFSG